MYTNRFLFQKFPSYSALLAPHPPPFRVISTFFDSIATFHAKCPPITNSLKMRISSQRLRAVGGSEIIEEEEHEEEDVCPVDCVREFYTDEEFLGILERSKGTKSLVVVDFYRTSCGSCKYIEQGFAKLCRGAGDKEAAVIFLKHNVIDEYDEQSEVADRLRIKAVPLFQFYKDGVLVEAFPTRDKERILAAIQKYTSQEYAM